MCKTHFFWHWQKVCCHGNGILWQKWGENLASRTTSSVFHQFSWNLAQMFALGCRCARHIFFDSGRKCVAMVTAYYGKNGGKILRRELRLPQFFTNSHEIWHRCLPWGVDVQDTFFDSGRKCVAMVTAYYGKNGGKIVRRVLLPQFFTNSHEIWHRCLPWGVDVQEIYFWQWQKVCCHGNGIWQKWGEKSCVANYFLSFSPILMKFGTDVCLGV